MNGVQISKASAKSYATLVRWVNGRLEMALNWRELEFEAMEAIEPELRRRWSAYWAHMAEKAAIMREIENAVDLIEIVVVPSAYYDCPAWLAAKTIWPTAEPAPALMVEAAQ